MAETRRRYVHRAVVPPAKCHRAIHRLIAVVLEQPDEAWRTTGYTGEIGSLDEYHARIAWRLSHEGTRYCVEFEEALLLRLFRRIRGLENTWSIEPEVWLAIIKINARPLPREIGLALAEKNYYGTQLALATSDQHPDVYWEVASREVQGRNRFARRLMVEDRFSSADIERFLDLYGRDARGGLPLYGIMRGGAGAPEEKLALLRRWERRTRPGEGEPRAGSEEGSEVGPADVSEGMSKSGSECS